MMQFLVTLVLAALFGFGLYFFMVKVFSKQILKLEKGILAYKAKKKAKKLNWKDEEES